MKLINSFDILTDNLPKTQTVRRFNISGDANAVFDLKITNAAGKFYNFITKDFQTNQKYTTTSVTSVDVDGRFVIINAVNTNIKVGMTVTGNGIASKTLVSSIGEQSIVLSESQQISAGTTLTFTADAGLNRQELSNSGFYKNQITFPEVSGNDTYTVLFEASAFDDTELNALPFEVDKKSVVLRNLSTNTYGDSLTSGFRNKLFKSITINQYIDTTITINASSPTLTGLSVDYSSNSFTIVKPRTFNGTFKTSFSWTFTTTTASAIVKSKDFESKYFETTKTQTVNGAVSSSRTVVMDSVDNIKVGMKATGTGLSAAADKVMDVDVVNKKITLNNARSISDGVTITFTATGSNGPEAYGTELHFTNLTSTLAPLTVTVASDSTDSTALTLSSAAYIQDGSTTIIKGPGIDVDETTTSITERVGGSDNITLSAAKSVEAGQTLTIEGSSSAVTLTGDVILKQMGDTNFTTTLQLDDFIGIGVS